MSDESSTSRTRWAELVGDEGGADYERRMTQALQELAERGEDPHGEATLVLGLLPEGGRVLDAGCGTGRVALRLAELGVPVVGVDADLSMLRVAADANPRVPFWLAGNVIPLLAPGTLDRVMANLAGVLKPEGIVVAGFGLDDDHLPTGIDPTPLEEYDAACAAAGLVPVERRGTWSGADFTGDAYVVALHRRRSEEASRPMSRLRTLLRH